MDGGTSNFAILKLKEPQLFRLGALAEHYFAEDPNTCHIKLRQFSELAAQLTASRLNVDFSVSDNHSDLLRRLKFANGFPKEVSELFHALRVSGNQAAHELTGDHSSALTALKVGRQVAIWYLRTFYSPAQKFGPFVPPSKPLDAAEPLRAELDRLQLQLTASLTDSHRTQAALKNAEIATQNAIERANFEREERNAWEALAEEAEKGRLQLSAQLEVAKRSAASDKAPDPEIVLELAQDAAEQIDLDEADTRTLIDQQLREAGWETDSAKLRYSKGVRPTKGTNRAIAEWPTETGPADYALFCGLTLVGTIEAKRRNRNVMAVLRQAERYASGFDMQEVQYADGGPWQEFKAPFAFSTNGRPYLKQVEALSGIWRRDLRDPNNPSEVLAGWPSPRGILDRLAVDKVAAHNELAQKPFDFGFPLRHYQKAAIEAVERGLFENQRAMLVAMATGTGKTKLAIAMLYRLISSPI